MHHRACAGDAQGRPFWTSCLSLPAGSRLISITQLPIGMGRGAFLRLPNSPRRGRLFRQLVIPVRAPGHHSMWTGQAHWSPFLEWALILFQKFQLPGMSASHSLATGLLPETAERD